MRLYIPTYKRPNSQLTFENWLRPLKEWTDRLWFVVHETEAELFRWHPRLVVVPKDKIGAPVFRQFAIDHAVSESESKVFMLDDDLTFAARVADWEYGINTSLYTPQPWELGVALDRADRDLDDLAGVSFSARGFNNGIPWHPYRSNYRMMMAFGVRADVLQEHGIRFDKFPFWEDFHVTLELLHRGYPNRVYMDFCHQAPTNKFGGVSTYRTLDYLKSVREEFAAFHAPYVKKVDKQSDYWGGELGSSLSSIPDVQIDWKKAARDMRNVT